MEQDFYKNKLLEREIKVLIPDAAEREKINDIIFRELCQGIISEESKKEYLKIIDGLSEKGAEAIVLGCTEIGLLVRQEDTEMPLFDTAYIHAKRAALNSIS